MRCFRHPFVGASLRRIVFFFLFVFSSFIRLCELFRLKLTVRENPDRRIPRTNEMGRGKAVSNELMTAYNSHSHQVMWLQPLQIWVTAGKSLWDTFMKPSPPLKVTFLAFCISVAHRYKVMVLVQQHLSWGGWCSSERMYMTAGVVVFIPSCFQFSAVTDWRSVF